VSPRRGREGSSCFWTLVWRAAYRVRALFVPLSPSEKAEVVGIPARKRARVIFRLISRHCGNPFSRSKDNADVHCAHRNLDANLIPEVQLRGVKSSRSTSVTSQPNIAAVQHCIGLHQSPSTGATVQLTATAFLLLLLSLLAHTAGQLSIRYKADKKPTSRAFCRRSRADISAR